MTQQSTTSQVPGVMLYRHCYDAFQGLSLETVGQLTVALMEYAFFAVVPDLPAELQVAWSFLKNYADRDAERYALKVTHRRAAAGKRWEKEAEKENTPTGTQQKRPPCERGLLSEAKLGDSKKRIPPSALTGSHLPLTREALDTAPQEKKEQQTFGNIEWMEQHVYRDEKGVIRYK